MNNTTPKENVSNQEIDLAFLYNSLKNFVDNIGFTVFRIINFYLRNIIVTVILTLLGVGLGYYQYTNNPKAYKHEIIVAPNFNSTGYLYNKVQGLGKSDENSSLGHISEAKIEPIIDIFQFVSDSKQNLEIAKYMSENTIEVNKFKKNNDVEKLYKYHVLSYYTDVKDSDSKIYEAIIQALNNDAYLNQRQKIEILETKNKLVELQTSVDNINNIFKKLGSSSENSKDVNVEMYSQINDLMLTKNELLKQINKTKVEIVEQEKVIFDASKNLNNSNKSFLGIIAYPVLFNFIFLMLAWVSKLFKRYKLRIQG